MTSFIENFLLANGSIIYFWSDRIRFNQGATLLFFNAGSRWHCIRESCFLGLIEYLRFDGCIENFESLRRYARKKKIIINFIPISNFVITSSHPKNFSLNGLWWAWHWFYSSFYFSFSLQLLIDNLYSSVSSNNGWAAKDFIIYICLYPLSFGCGTCPRFFPLPIFLCRRLKIDWHQCLNVCILSAEPWKKFNNFECKVWKI